MVYIYIATNIHQGYRLLQIIIVDYGRYEYISFIYRVKDCSPNDSFDPHNPPPPECQGWLMSLRS